MRQKIVTNIIHVYVIHIAIYVVDYINIVRRNVVATIEQ